MKGGGEGGEIGDCGKAGGEGGDVGGQGVVQSALAAPGSAPTVTTASNSLLIVHTWMATAAPAISYDSPSPSVCTWTRFVVSARATFVHVPPSNVLSPEIVLTTPYLLPAASSPRKDTAWDLEEKVAVHRGPQVERGDEGYPPHRGPRPVLHASAWSVVRDHALGSHPTELEAVGRVKIVQNLGTADPVPAHGAEALVFIECVRTFPARTRAAPRSDEAHTRVRRSL
eukprot:scaffold87815_cov59-Phaeocystis_antarctica.AAC.4